MVHDERLLQEVARQPYPLLFMTLSGAHLYGFPSPDSDYDLRGVHILPLREVIGLYTKHETIEVSTVRDGYHIDLVTHDVKKGFMLLLKKDCMVLEQLYSPLVLHTTPEHEELKAIARACITRHHCRHYLGLAQAQWQLCTKESPPRVKPLLYVYRALLAGIHLMRTGEVEANLARLNESFQLSYIPDLIAHKLAGAEHATLAEVDMPFHQAEYTRLRQSLEEASQTTSLPDGPAAAAKAALHDLLLRVRLGHGASGTVR